MKTAYLPEEIAWIVLQYVSGRTQASIANELKDNSCAICTIIGDFCLEWTKTNMLRIYNEKRKEVAVCALKNYFTSCQRIKKPDGLRKNDYPSWDYYDARMEYAFLLRCERLTYGEIGEHLEMTKERARQIVLKFAKRLTKATKRARWNWSHK